LKPYTQLTPRGRILRLRQLALQALNDYPINVARVRFLAEESTTMFRVDAVNGHKYVLRIYSEADSSLAENQTEMVWLTALARDTDLPVIRPVARKDGETISRVRHAGIPQEKRCALYHWIPGTPLADHLSPQNYRKLGALMAGLHQHAASLPLPARIQPKRWDKTYYFPGEEIVYNTPAYRHLYTPAQIKIIDRAVTVCDNYLASLYQRDDPPHLLHGDLHYWNVHLHRGTLYALDFEDMLLGYPEHDIAISLYYLRDETHYPQLAAAFQQGYTEIKEYPHLPDDKLHPLWLARMTNFVNYAATAFDDAESARAYISARCQEIDQYLK
jgi:Ser/Thr protein kinase RdoA (MazF antagonist)